MNNQCGSTVQAPHESGANRISITLAFLTAIFLGTWPLSSPAQTASRAAAEPTELEIDSLLTVAAEHSDTQAQQTTLYQVAELVETRNKVELSEAFELNSQLPTATLSSSSIESDTAIVYAIALSNRLIHLVLQENNASVYEVDIPRERLSRTIKYYGQELQISASFGGMERASAELYRWLVRPYVADLRQSNVQRIIFVPAAGIRHLPIATLFDGQRYLIEEFSVAVSLGISASEPAKDTPALVTDYNQNSEFQLSIAPVQNSRDGALVATSSKVLSSEELPSLRLLGAYLAVKANSNLVSLWPVSAEANELLTNLFIEGLASGSSKIEALQNAQLQLKNSPRFSHPFFWGAFQLVGDWH